MLVVSRKLGETVRVADNVEITIVAIVGNRVRLGITAPRQTAVVRSECLSGTDDLEFDFEAKEYRLLNG